MAAVAPAVPPAPLQVLPPPFLQTLVKNPNVSAACVAGANLVLQNTLLARQAEFFSGRVTEGLNLLLPPVLKDIAFAADKRVGMGEFVYQVPLWSLGVPDSCGYIGLNYCQIDAVPVFAKWGVCVPSECTAHDIMTAVFPPITQRLADRIKTTCGSMTADKALFITVEPISTAAWCALMLVLLLVLLALGATILDMYGEEWQVPFFKKEGSLRRVLQCFSMTRTYASLMAPPRGGPFASFEAIRTLAMCMILLGHTMFFNISVVGLTNPREALGFHGRGFLATMPGLIATGCLLGVDTFLVMAGFLAFYLFMKEMSKRLTPPPMSRKGSDAGPTAATRNSNSNSSSCNNGAKNSIKVLQMALVSYVRRYLRLTPAYAVMLLIFTTLAPLMSSAPPSPTGLLVEAQQCKEKWWENMLYINNILSNPYTMCYQASWFLAVVQQLFLFVPWLSALAFLRPKWGLAVGGGLCLASYVYTFQQAEKEGWRINSIDRPGFPKFFADFYAGTFTRMPTFLIGGMAAVVWFHWGEQMKGYWGREGRRKVTGQVWGAMGVAMVLFALTMFGPYRELAYAPGSWSQRISSLYITLSWSGWVMGLVLMCGVLALGRGGWIKRFLEMPFWAVTSRLTYSTYLVHPMAILTAISSAGGQPAHFSMLNLFNTFLGYSTLSAISAVVFFFLVEAPFGELERLLFSRLPPAPLKGKGMEGGEGEEQEVNKETLLVMSLEVAKDEGREGRKAVVVVH